MSALDTIVLSKGRFRKVIQARPFQPNSSKSSRVDHAPRNVPSENNFKKGAVKRKNKFGRAFLNLIKESVPCIAPRATCADGTRADGFFDVTGIPSRPVNKLQVSSAFKVSADYNAGGTRVLEEHIPPLSSSVPASTQTTPERSAKFFRGPKVVDSKLPFFQCAPPVEKPSATHSGSFYQMAQLNSCPPTKNIPRLCICGCPTFTKGATHGAKHRVSEAFHRADPLNIYGGSVDAPPPKPRSITPVDTIRMKTKPSFVRTSVKRERKKRPASRPISRRRCHFKTRRIITSPRYTMRGVDIIYTRRKRFRRYKHLQTLSTIAEKDETTNDDYSSSDSESVPSIIGGYDLGFSPIFIEDPDCEDGMAGIVSMGVGKVEPRYMAVNSKGDTSTAGNPCIRNRRFSGLRPLLLPVRVALRDGC